jgi:hypothetical protein
MVMVMDIVWLAALGWLFSLLRRSGEASDTRRV